MHDMNVIILDVFSLYMSKRRLRKKLWIGISNLTEVKFQNDRLRSRVNYFVNYKLII